MKVKTGCKKQLRIGGLNSEEVPIATPEASGGLRKIEQPWEDWMRINT